VNNPQAHTPRTTAPIQSLQRAVAILRSFSEAEQELSVTELSRRLGLHKSTVSRILATLQQEGLVGRNPESGKYGLGLGLVSLGGMALGRLDVRGIALPHLNPLVALTEETVIVTALEGRECVNIARASSPKTIQFVGWIGRRTPLHCTASGKIFLAYAPEQARASLLPDSLARFTANTIVDLPTLEQCLAQVRSQGYAIVHGEYEEGFSEIAAPIFDHQGQVAATIAISGPTFRLGPGRIETFVAPLLETTFAISGQLGYRGAP
jgi:DNA-binding IclR family transcriptional regulator